MAIESAVEGAAVEANLKQFLLVLSVSLGVATLTRVFSWLRHIPYTLLLVIVGLLLALADVRLVYLSPSLILSIFLPPLLFEAAWNLRWADLKRDMLPICLYAVIGVVISIAGVAIGLNQITGLSLSAALLIGACLSATDPISVTALFRELGTSKRLITLMEGESLFNDGMAVVSFGFLVTSSLGNAELALQPILVQFVKVVGIGIAVGGLIGFGISYLTQRFDLPLVEQSFTLVSAYGAYLITDDLGGSGVIGVVTTSLILGNFGSRIGMSARTRLVVSDFWEFLAFFVNSIIFLVIGDQIRFTLLRDNLGIIATTVAGMILTRAIAIYFLGFLSNRFANSQISVRKQTVLWWGGLRGAVSIALALSVPISIPERGAVIATVFGSVLFTLLVQGLTIQPLLEKLQLIGDQPLRQRYLELVARQAALNRVQQHLSQIDKRPGIEPEFCSYLETQVDEKIKQLSAEVDQLQEEFPNLGNFVTEQLVDELLMTEVDTYAEFIRLGRLNQELSPFLLKFLNPK
ncbi:Na+/H+ antiporter [Aetokthonos hydrillicola Thurmond2011]|jgi:CPA1 family monovalent cation:H+ antiporter|uniref:Na+/H+ antiporter n=1 Tax=Aetokthonos hydrillicola Thurmond2011 TaxID=2712845 RepID=A0AAP5IA37_9CYAN|nr:Na+/H+ antiporter [Aetokthonos hydrillicola]MBO3458368.1 Na+/H+ antiporter [Aetokthonos hydrillicola CCALA 1050]MBW4586093.1 Na+/H+ antiporter [Aetokthonos hydrillicola CCALA 1050]MDR9897700.1 Na+/H+ antiporter [Aetokthonos hydrillicola Thurmond2011]